MAGRLVSDRYGKHQVRVSKVRRPRNGPANAERHEFVEVAVDVELEGDFAAAFTDGDNTGVVATDTCKNTIYVLAKQDSMETIESFGLTIVQHFIDTYGHVSRCVATLRETVWDRIEDHDHGFTARDSATPFARVELTRGGSALVVAGIEGLTIAKTTESGFTDFHADEYRTLADTNDRILATQMTAEWSYSESGVNFAEARQLLMEALLKRFLDHYSRSVQETLYFMGQAAIDSCSAVAEISLTMPNKHHLLANLKPFELDNDNEVFVVTDEPFGYITGTVAR